MALEALLEPVSWLGRPSRLMLVVQCRHSRRAWFARINKQRQGPLPMP